MNLIIKAKKNKISKINLIKLFNIKIFLSFKLIKIN